MKDLIEYCFIGKGLVGLIFSNSLPFIGTKLYDFNNKNFNNTCLFWFVLNIISSIAFISIFKDKQRIIRKESKDLSIKNDDLNED